MVILRWKEVPVMEEEESVLYQELKEPFLLLLFGMTVRYDSLQRVVWLGQTHAAAKISPAEH